MVFAARTPSFAVIIIHLSVLVQFFESSKLVRRTYMKVNNQPAFLITVDKFAHATCLSTENLFIIHEPVRDLWAHPAHFKEMFGIYTGGQVIWSRSVG